VSNPLDLKSAKQLCTTAIFTWGVANVIKYARWDSDFDDFIAAPEMEVATEKQHGGIQDVPYQVTLRSDRQPIADLIRPYAHATVQVEVGEADPDDFVATYRMHFKGEIAKSTRFAKNLARLVRVDIVGWKERMGFPLGVLCDTTCQHVLGDIGCGIHLSPQRQSLICTNVSTNTITTPGIDLTGRPADWFLFGEAHFDRLRLMITKIHTGDAMELIKPPPPEWLGASIDLYPGCNKEYAGDCLNKWNNQSRFLGLGFAMPIHNPQSEPG
jgi:hypothetical protein